MDLTGWDAAAALAKAITYAATLAAAGTIIFLTYATGFLRAAQRRSMLRSVVLLSCVGILASIARISLLAASMSDGAAGMFDWSLSRMVLRAGEGDALALRIAGLMFCLAARRSARGWRLIALAGALLAAASFAAVGHVHALHPDRLATLILMLHLWCAAFWLGALWPLLRVARDAGHLTTAALAGRFGRIALYVVALLLAAGVLLSCRLLGSIAALWSTDYGRLLSLKLLLVAALLSAAAVNKLRLTPQVAGLTGAVQASAVMRLRRSIRFEMLAACLILLVTASFTSLTGP